MREIQEGRVKTPKEDDNWNEICDRMHASIENNGEIPSSCQVRNQNRLDQTYKKISVNY